MVVVHAYLQAKVARLELTKGLADQKVKNADGLMSYANKFGSALTKHDSFLVWKCSCSSCSAVWRQRVD